MTLSRLRWITMMAAIAFLICVQGLAMMVVMPGLGRIYGHLLSIFGFSAGVFVLSTALFRQVDRMQAEGIENERYVAILEERERLSREMHDSLSQVLAYLHLKANVALRQVAARDTAAAHETLAEIAARAHEAYADVREAIMDLRQSVSVNGDFVLGLDDYLQRFHSQTGLRVELDVEDPSPPRLTPSAEVQLMRVIQEALANVRKHAATGQARVCLSPGERGLVVTIEDDGDGFDLEKLSAAGGSYGVSIMRERIERLGGHFRITSSPQRGTSVQILIPFAGGKQ